MNDNYYQYDQHKSKPKVVKRIKWFFWGGLVAAVLVVVGFFTYSFFIVKPADDLPTSSIRTSVIAPDISVFRTQYFQFQASKNWQEVSSDEEDIFRFRAIRDPLTEHDLTVYINPTQPEINRLRATRAQVVEVVEDGTLTAVGGMTDPCVTSGSDVKDNDMVSFNETTFKCVAGGALYDVLVSQKDGTPVIPMNRPDGSTINVVIYYRDLRAVPDGRELKRIVDTFQVR